MEAFIDVIPFALLGGLLGLDFVSFPQAMISRPIVSATLAGVLMGEPVHGLTIGVALEFVAIETLPFGASRYPEWGSAGVVGGALFSGWPDTTAGTLAVSVFAALATAMLSGWSLQPHRRLIARRAASRKSALLAGSLGAVTGLQLYGLTLDFLRAALLSGASLLLFRPIVSVLLSDWPVAAPLSRAGVVAIVAAVGASAVWKVIHGTKGAAWYLAGGFLLGGGTLWFTR
ncbi:MAG: PTS sugar transporter subunit IIC [Gemmatimonadaceae bacterium]|nr:PTS sugar transporter subunit IIC [Gemmatimonadaceae bacterium]